MLFVDLDNSLIKSDYLYESFVNYFSKNVLAPFICLFVYSRYGKVGLKKFLYEKSDISVINLPYNEKVLNFIKDWKKKYPVESIYLISASYNQVVDDIAQHLNCFDGAHGSNNQNIKSHTKLKKINELTDDKIFSYIGDSIDDLIIWENAKKCILVNPSKNLIKKVKKINPSIEVITNKEIITLKEILKTIRVHQWVKNALLFVPAILALEPLFYISESLIVGFFAFSFTASAFYIFNDLFDIENDRNHHSKKYRSFASGTLSILHGFFIFCLLMFAAMILALNLPQSFQICLILYVTLSFLYSKYLKKIPILDIFILSYLYLIRIISGGVLVGIDISNWLLTFSVFFFLFLASIKRWVELKRLNSASMPGRGYQLSDISFMSQLSYFSGLISVLIICLYIESQQELALYNSSIMLWFIPVILLYWILETLFKVERNQVDDDPVKYALKSKTSYFSLLGFIIILLASSTI